MIQYCDIPLCNPVKFYKNAIVSEGIDGDWALNQIRSFEVKRCYAQKWVTGDQTDFVIISTIAPADLKVYNKKGVVVKTIPFTNPVINVWTLKINLDGIGSDIFYLFIDCTLLMTSFKWISEGIYVKDKWPITKVIEYYSDYNDQDIPFPLGFKLRFRCEMDIMDWEFLSDDNSFVDEIHDTKLESATPYRQGKLYVANEVGVAPWVIDILNRARCCNNVFFNGLKIAFPQGSKWDITRSKGWPLIGASIDVVEAINLTSNQQMAGAIEPGIVTGYIMNTNFFGTAQQIQITEVEKP